MAMDDRDGVIWLDGEWLPWRDAKVHVLTHTLHYGCGVFEGLRAYKTDRGAAIFRLRDHTDRLFRSAHIMNMKIPFDKDILDRAQCEAVSRNGLSSAYIRPMCFYGSEGMGLHAKGLNVHVMIAAWEWGSYLGAENMARGIKVRTSSYTRNSVNSVMCKAKANGNYLNSILAVQEAVEAGCDEALLLDHEGYVAEGSGENIFIVRRGKLYTPDLTSALEGITRETVFTIARENGLEVVEKRITRDEVYVADEAFFTGTAAEVTPIREVDGRTIGEGGRGPITEKLQTLYFDYVHGRRNDHQEWLSYVG
ncbi:MULTISPECIES: branched-chain amino acid transaminase [unclassified Methylocaldum]|jgi:branched-chain amino acid aminotransferase|uniref:branched-chain amino acid transaminase n=1 Tax=unclassified Methylocaldum TaxID=2622260 RepID=UPI00098AF576|nr:MULTISPECIES: branched-chain amino acid transaminase [unclassified Methylocaldum]MBP1149807.1 branched-chain amino acid aminotransferase [Methylocaldum sp. RMAD-M]MDV3242072.1 branched-chain amino acid transaminase [Methylocaldum sp.]MVF22189.1 branched-chain amino acid transaminase [Methylocaldum sp. BRCS4]